LPAYLSVQWPNLATRTDDNDALLDTTARSIVSMAAGKSPTPSLTKTEFSSEIVRYVRASSTRGHATSSSGGPFTVLVWASRAGPAWRTRNRFKVTAAAGG